MRDRLGYRYGVRGLVYHNCVVILLVNRSANSLNQCWDCVLQAWPQLVLM